jgi:Ca2+-transporting ATPase
MKRSVLWALSPPREIYKNFEVEPGRGLTESEASRRLKQWGSNALQEKKQKGIIEIFLDQFKDFMVLVLLAATLISGLLKEYNDALTIIIIVILNAILGFIQEYRAERSFAALKKLSASRGKVLRDGLRQEIPTEKVVPGDIVFLEAGDRVCADIRIMQTDTLMIDESPLTGESTAVKKEAGTLNTLPSSPGDTNNMVFNGTLVLSGKGYGVVVATGMETEMGRIALLIQEAETGSTPLQRRLAKLGKYLVATCLLLCLGIALLGLWRGEEIYKMFMAGISLAVAAIPEGLPAIVTISLALGVQRMVRRKAIVRRLPAVETLGCATVICADKTGTITQNKLTVKSIYTNGRFYDVEGEGYDLRGGVYQGKNKINVLREPHLYRMFLIMTLCNNASLQRPKGRFKIKNLLSEGQIQGDPLEGALLVCAAKVDFRKEQLEKKYSKIKEFPFNASRKCMSVIYQEGEEKVVYVKGAPESLLEKSAYILEDGRVKPLSAARRRKILSQVDKMAAGALRTLAVAYKLLPEYSASLKAEEIETGLVFVGFSGMLDPPRPAVFKAIQSCVRAGISIKMITGDHRHTAMAIGQKTGILRPGSKVVTGEELDRMNESELSRRIESFSIFARVNPEHKLRIVRCLKAQGHIVAMTGDGVNDAPAVKEADIGIAMGSTGTDVTKEAASLILADDNFKTIVAAVEEGRNIYENIRKFIRFLLGCNLGEILTMLLAMLWGLPLPLRPIQILWVNLVTDGLPAIALGMEPPEDDVMQSPPRSPQEGILGRGLWKKILARGIIIGVTTVLMFALALLHTEELVYAQTMALSTLILTQLLHVFECRSEHLTIWETNPGSNRALVGAVVFSFFLLIIIVYNPFLQNIFKTYPLRAPDWYTIIAASVLPYFASFFLRKKKENRFFPSIFTRRRSYGKGQP